MVRAATPVKRLPISASLTVLLATAGCTALPTSISAPLGIGTSAPQQIAVAWSKEVGYIPDPTKNGAPSAAILGRLYIFSGDKSGKPITSEGNLVVELFDDSVPMGAQGSKLLEQTVFPADVFATLVSKDQIGIAYTIGVPCPTEARLVHLSTRFEPANGGKPLVYSSEV